MTDLERDLGREALEELARAFTRAVGAPVWLLTADGDLLAGRAEGAPATEAPVALGGRHVATVATAAAPEAARRPLELMGEVLVRLSAQARLLRARVEELAAMYRLTEGFSGRTDLKEILQLAAETMTQVVGADACSIRVFNEDRTELVTMAAHGLSREYMAKGPILLSRSRIDQEVLTTRDCVYIADERTDPRVLYPAEARREGIVSALCAPMIYKGGTEGVIRVYTRRPHRFGWFETSLVRGVASQAASAIVNLRLYREALTADRMSRQLKMAAEVQRRMIPPSAPNVPGLDIAAIYVPCFELGGDFYDFIDLANGNLGVCVGDVKGKGVPASLLMASARASLRAHARHLYALSDVLAAVNADMLATSDESDFVTLFYGVLDVPNRRLTYCSAGHEPALLVRDGADRVLPSSGGVIGMFPDMSYRHEVLQLRSGDVLAVSTDGLPEQMNFRDEPFGRRRARRAVVDACRRGESAEGIGRHQLWEMRRFAGLQTRCDDLTLVTIKLQ